MSRTDFHTARALLLYLLGWWGLVCSNQAATNTTSDAPQRPAELQRVLQLLKEPAREAELAAARVEVRRRGGSIVPHLLALLDDKDHRVANEVASLLCELNDKRAIEPFIVWMEKPETEAVYPARFQVALFLAASAEPKAVKTLLLVLRDCHRCMQYSAASALTVMSRESPKAFRQGLRQAPLELRRAAVSIVSDLPGDESLLKEFVDDDDDEVRKGASEAIKKLKQATSPAK